jgi:hypothetical protein
VSDRRKPGGLPATKAMGVRAPYKALPPRVAAWIERELGSQVVRATTYYGGFLARYRGPGLPTIREYQRLVGDTLLRLVKQRTGW